MLLWHYVYNQKLVYLLSGTQAAWVSSTFGIEGLALPRYGDWPCLLPDGLTIFGVFAWHSWSLTLSLHIIAWSTWFVSHMACYPACCCAPYTLMGRGLSSFNMLPCAWLGVPLGETSLASRGFEDEDVLSKMESGEMDCHGKYWRCQFFDRELAYDRGPCDCLLECSI